MRQINHHLIPAAKQGNLRKLQEILEQGANPNTTNNIGETALMMAAQEGNEAAIEELLERPDTKLSIKCKKESTAIDHAIENNNITIALKILKSAIERFVSDNDPENTNEILSPFDYLSEASRNILTDKFFNIAYPQLGFISNDSKNSYFTVLLKNPAYIIRIIKIQTLDTSALKDILLDMQIYLLNRDPEPMATLIKAKYAFIDSLLETLVLNYYSERSINIDAIITSIMEQQNISKEELYSDSFLFWPCPEEKFFIRIKKYFSNQTVHRKLKKVNNGGALIQAAKLGNLLRVEHMLAEGVDTNYLNDLNQNALMWAAYKKNEEILALLLDQTKITTKTKYGVTALICAVIFHENQTESTNVARQILKKLQSELSDNAKLQNHINQSKCKPNGDNALIISARHGYKSSVEILLSKGANADIQNNNGNTALIIAARHGYNSCIEILLTNGADVDLQNKSGNTALIVAAANDRFDTAKLLIKNGASLTTRNYRDSTAIDLAIKNDLWSTALGIFKLAVEKSVEDSATKKIKHIPSPFDCLSETSRNVIANSYYNPALYKKEPSSSEFDLKILITTFFNSAFPKLEFVPNEFRSVCFIYLLKNPYQIRLIKELPSSIQPIDTSAGEITSVHSNDNVQMLNVILTKFFTHQSQLFYVHKAERKKTFITILENIDHIKRIIRIYNLNDNAPKDILIDMQMYLLKRETSSTPVNITKYDFVKSLLDKTIALYSQPTEDSDLELMSIIDENIQQLDKVQKHQVYQVGFFGIYKSNVEALVDKLQGLVSNKTNLNQDFSPGDIELEEYQRKSS